jgi:hypothetical protein
MTRTSEPDFEEGTLNGVAIEPDEIEGEDRFGYKVVALVGYHKVDWAAYRGPTTWSDEQVAATGDKITRDAAFALFPTLAGTLRYRE